MDEAFVRSEMLYGEHAMQKLRDSHVAVFGLGGVGGAVIESLARTGIGELTLIDRDIIDRSNLNRQILATQASIGRLKTEVAAERVAAIHPGCRTHELPLFYLPETADQVDLSRYDYVIDAIDNVTAKLLLAERCYALGVPLIAAMGAGNRIHAAGFTVADIYDTHNDKLARVMRRELRKRGVPRLKVVYSPAPAVTPSVTNEKGERVRPPFPGSTAFVPPVCGLMLAAEVVQDLIQEVQATAAQSRDLPLRANVHA